MCKSQENVYSDLNILLTDICSFLSNLNQYELSSNNKKHATELISRCKAQLQALAKVCNAEYDGRYVDMGKAQEALPEYIEPGGACYPPPLPSKDENLEQLTKESDVSSSIDDEVCPYKNLSASDASIDKNGFLEKREKFVLYHYQKKIYAAVVDKWLLLYNSNKDARPVETYHSLFYNVKPIKEKSFQMEKRGGDPRGKILYFTASTPKDMLQWISAISGNSVTPTESNRKDNLSKTDSDDTAVDDLYEELQHTRDEEKIKPKESSLAKPKPVPPPIVPKEPPLPVRNKTVTKKDIVARNSTISENSFSDSGSGDYDFPINTHDSKHGPSSPAQNEEEEDVEYDTVVNERNSLDNGKCSSIATSPATVPLISPKPIPMVKPKFQYENTKVTPKTNQKR